MKKVLGDNADPKSWAKVIQACDDYRKAFCPSLRFDDLIGIMKDMQTTVKDQSELFKVMNDNLAPQDMPLMDLKKYMDSSGDVHGLRDYVRYYKIFFNELDKFVKFMDEIKSS